MSVRRRPPSLRGVGLRVLVLQSLLFAGCWTLQPGTDIRLAEGGMDTADSSDIGAPFDRTDLGVSVADVGHDADDGGAPPDRSFFDVRIDAVDVSVFDASPIDVSMFDAPPLDVIGDRTVVDTDFSDRAGGAEAASEDVRPTTTVDAPPDLGAGGTDLGSSDVPVTTCTTPCTGGSLCCAGRCIDPLTDRQNCGRCDTRCAAQCLAGRCNAVQDIRVGPRNTCVRLTDSTVWCWGDRTWGNFSMTEPRPDPRPWRMEVFMPSTPSSRVPLLTSTLEGGAYSGVFCANDSSATATWRCWGAIVADGTPTASGFVSVNGISRMFMGEGWWTAINASGNFVEPISGTRTPGFEMMPRDIVQFCLQCGRRPSGAVWCITGGVAAPLATLTDARDLSSWAGAYCAVRSSGSVECWADSTVGMSRFPGLAIGSSPAAVPALGTARKVVFTDDTVCALRTDGTVACVGGDSRIVDGAASLHDLIDLRGNQHHVCALTQDGRVLCWGDNAYGQLGADFGVRIDGPVEPNW